MSDSHETPAEHEARRVIEAIRGAVPTSRHATMLFDMVRSDLGEDAVVDTAAGRTLLRLHRRDSSGAVLPHPLFSVNTKGRIGHIVPLVGPGEALPPSDEAPALRNVGPCEIIIHDGTQSITATYGEDGRCFETSRSASLSRFGDLVSHLASGSANPVDLLAKYVTRIDLERHGPGRVLYPVPLPGGVAVAWNVGSWSIRDALFDGRLPEGAAWVVADGYAGTALVWGATCEEALDAWREEVQRSQPVRAKPPPQTKPDEPESVEVIDAGPDAVAYKATIRGPSPDVSWPEPALENTPAVVIPIAATPTEPHPFGAWMRLTGKQGATVFALRREDPGGLTLVGERLAEVADLDQVGERVDAVSEVEHVPPPPGVEEREYDSRLEIFQVVDESTGEPVEARRLTANWSYGLRGRQLDGDGLRWKVLRQRWYGAR